MVKGVTNLPEALADIAAADDLLVALDFDGTLADLRDDPMSVRPREGNTELVTALSKMPRTDVILLSGRQLKDLRYLSGMEHAAKLVGSHGAEPDDGLALTAAESALLEAIDLRLKDVLEEPVAEGAWVERKPAGRVLHVRLIDDVVRKAAVIDHAKSLFRPVGGIHVTDGKDLLEITVLDVTKGSYLDAARRQDRADREARVLFIGDDVTDETVFRILRSGDLGIRVGDPSEPTAATHHLPDTAAVTEFLGDLVVARGKAVGA